jgi:hypothetical protein
VAGVIANGPNLKVGCGITGDSDVEQYVGSHLPLAGYCLYICGGAMREPAHWYLQRNINGSGTIEVSDNHASHHGASKKSRRWYQCLTSMEWKGGRWSWRGETPSLGTGRPPALLSCPASTQSSLSALPLQPHTSFSCQKVSHKLDDLTSALCMGEMACIVHRDPFDFRNFPKERLDTYVLSSSILPFYTSVGASMSLRRSSTVQPLSEPVSVSSEGPFL